MPSEQEIQSFRFYILKWFAKNKRNYPWREAEDPFRLIIAEIMLQRTNADQVKNVYTELFEKYPDSYSISKAAKKDIEKILYPLGLRWRIPLIISLAQEIQEKYNGKVPQTKEELMKLSGVGDYISGAVLSIAFNKKEWIVDSNIVRLFKRYFGIETSKEGRRDKHVIEIAKVYSSFNKSREGNLAILDFSALVCTPKNPNHKCCGLNKKCYEIKSMRTKSNFNSNTNNRFFSYHSTNFLKCL